jgi:polysaccharide deacetylase 2 family uncharacterized protein YibQ
VKKKKIPGRLHLYIIAALVILVIILLIQFTEKDRRIARSLVPSVPSKAPTFPEAGTPQTGQKPPSEKPGPEPQLPPQEEKRTVSPRFKIALIIDDVGYPLDAVERYAGFRGKLTFSVLPNLAASAKYARFLHARGFEIMIHIPMEPEGYPSVNPGPGALLRSDGGPVIERKLKGMIEDVPFAVGANNHMGSSATKDCEVMERILKTLDRNNLFFIDSLTTGNSCARALAAKNRMRSARRDVFLDNVDSFAAINAQFETLKRIAKSRGTAIGIGHIHKLHTLEVLSHQLPLLEKEGFGLVFASEAVGSSALR